MNKWPNLSEPQVFSCQGISVLTYRDILKAKGENMCTKQTLKMFIIVCEIKMNIQVLYHFSL